MPLTARLKKQPPAENVLAGDPLGVHPLAEADREEALAFLAGRSVGAIFMSGLLYDNGPGSPLNRGAFCVFRGGAGELEGVALIGHATLVEARSERALEAFAALAKRCHTAHVIVGEQSEVERFWARYHEGGQQPRRVCRELHLELRWPVPAAEGEASLRRATPDDLPAVIEVNADMAERESGVNPLETDPEGFRQRTLRRIEQGRVWVGTDDRGLLFKAEVMAETPEVAYLEGVYVRPEDRRRGVGRRSMSQLARTLLANSRVVTLLVNDENKGAQSFFLATGFRLRGYYDTIFLSRM
ncbi:MAG TPA: GNAT family N-acetyltransferase [Pyrinomonadaceae bacterium]|nr:GNAT family N-acetyltransferase [Pyrinomonadaceae bacterium]